MAVDYDEVYEPMAFERPVGADMEQWRANVQKTDLYRRGDTVLVWVNEGDLYCDGPFVKRLVRRSDPPAATKSPEDGCTCRGCGALFRVDLNVPDDLWEDIRDGVNLLCGSCIMRRIDARGQFAAWSLTPTPA